MMVFSNGVTKFSGGCNFLTKNWFYYLSKRVNTRKKINRITHIIAFSRFPPLRVVFFANFSILKRGDQLSALIIEIEKRGAIY